MSQPTRREISCFLNDIHRVCKEYGLILGAWNENSDSDDDRGLIAVMQYSPGATFNGRQNVELLAHAKDIAPDREISWDSFFTVKNL